MFEGHHDLTWVDCSTYDSPQGVPCSVIKPIVEFVETLFRQEACCAVVKIPKRAMENSIACQADTAIAFGVSYYNLSLQLRHLGNCYQQFFLSFPNQGIKSLLKFVFQVQYALFNMAQYIYCITTCKFLYGSYWTFNRNNLPISF